MYKITNENGVNVAGNSKILKIRIKNNKLPDGIYHYITKKERKICFSIEYKTIVNPTTKQIRIIGEELNKK